MKKGNLYKMFAMSILACSAIFYSCKKHKDSVTTPTTPAAGTIVVKDSLSGNVHWKAGDRILIKGYVYAVKGCTLTIDPGVIIKGDKSTKGTLIMEQGSYIDARGTASNPIIFTSNQPAGQRTYGDWGGVILCGYAPVNWQKSAKSDGTSGTLPAGIGQVEGGPRSLYGGNNPHDNSGVLSYIRLEFGGVAFSPNNEINGFTFCGVGDGTTVDHLQVSYCGDDSYEWFGGNVNCKYLIAHRGWDDDFDTDCDYSGTIQFGMIYRDPNAADQSGSHSFESDSRNENASGALTKAVFSNITTVGPLTNPNYNGYNPNYVCGEIVRRASALSTFNTLFIGWPLGLIVDEDPSYGSTVENMANGTLKFKNNYVIGSPSYATTVVSRLNDPHSSPNSIDPKKNDSVGVSWGSLVGPYTWFNDNANFYPTFKGSAAEGITSRLLNAFNSTNPNFIPTTTSGVVYNYNSWTIPGSGGKTKAFPYDQSKPLNFDTTGQLKNYNAPAFPYDFTDLKSNSFITPVNYVGGFNLNDSWAQDWTNFDPVNANYGDSY